MTRPRSAAKVPEPGRGPRPTPCWRRPVPRRPSSATSPATDRSRGAAAETIPPLTGWPQRSRLRLWVGGVLLLIVIWLAVVCGYFVYSTDHDLREAMAEADRDNPQGWRLEDIEAQRDQVPDEENAALVVLQVRSLLPAGW